jgi:hypothetical protein
LTTSALSLAFGLVFLRARTAEIDGFLCRGPVIGRLGDAYGSNHTALLTNPRAISPHHFKPPTHRLGTIDDDCGQIARNFECRRPVRSNRNRRKYGRWPWR